MRARARVADTTRPSRQSMHHAIAPTRICMTPLLLCVAAAVKAPVRAAEPSMMVEEMTALSSISQTLAANAGDFGGMAAPIIGLGLLSAIIALLAGPIED